MSELTAIEQKEVSFLDGSVTAVMVQDEDGRENVYIPLKPLVESMGLDWSAQYKRVKNNAVLGNHCRSIAVTAIEPNRTRKIKMLAIPISHLNGFLFGINADRVKEKIRPLILEYQEKCYQVLFQAFNGVESMTRFYRAVGFDSGWIDNRIKKHTASTDLSDVWLLAGVPIEQHDQLQDVINSGTFGVTVAEHKRLKSISKKESLPDNMTRVELLVSAIADEAAVYLSNDADAKGYEESEEIAKRAGKVGKGAIASFENETGAKVLSSTNNLDKQKRPSLKDKNDA